MPDAADGSDQRFATFLREHWLSRSQMVAGTGIAFSVLLIGYDLTLYPETARTTIPLKVTTALVLATVLWLLRQRWFQEYILWLGPTFAAAFIVSIDWGFHVQGVQDRADRVFAYTASTFVIFFLLPMTLRAGLLYLTATYAAYTLFGARYGYPPWGAFGLAYTLQSAVIVSVGVIANRVFLQTKRRELEATAALADSQAALVRAESLAALGSLVTGAAHELRNPLGSSGGLLQLLAEEIEGSRELPESRRADMMQNLTLALQGQMRAADIADSLFSLSESLEHATPDAPLATVIETLRGRYPGAVISCDGVNTRTRVAQRALTIICSNLLDNALAAGGEKAPTLKVHLTPPASLPPLSVHGEGAGGRGEIVFTVSDSGRGIPAHQVGEVFKPFFTGQKTAPHRGVGLGLYLVHELAARLGGEARIESREGEGTTARVRVPLEG